MYLLAEAASDERGSLAYGQKGDQRLANGEAGEEVRIREISGDKDFTYILRYPDAAIRQKFANDAKDIARNQNYGYAQYGPPDDPYAGRYGIYEVMNEYKEFKDVKKPCNCDCSSMTSCVINHNGISVSMYMRTASERKILKDAGFRELSFSKKGCLPGDVLWREGHTAICVESDTKEDEMYLATVTSSKDTKMWSTGAGPKSRKTPYLTVRKTDFNFVPSVILCQQVGEILANTQWMRGQAHAYVANYENNATAGVAVGKAATYFNPDADVIYIPVRFPSKEYYVRIYP